MALDMTPEQKEIGRGNFHRVVGKLAGADRPGVTRRQFMQGLVAAGAALPLSAAAYYGYNNASFADRPVKAGLIGAGDEGGVLVGEHNPRYLEFIAYSDIRPSNQARIFEDERLRNPNSPRKGFKHHYGNDARQRIRLYENYRDMLANPEIEMVVIALPLHLHFEATMAALQAGKHVLCEKLMAWNITQCKQMVREAEQRDKLLAIGHQRHYSLLYAHANEVLQSGVLGEIRHIRALWHRNNAILLADNARDRNDRFNIYRDSWRPQIKAEDRAAFSNQAVLRRYGYKSLEELVRWRLYQRTGGGLMAELGSHQLDACSIFLGKKRPLSVTAFGGKHFYQDEREVEDHVYCSFEFPGKNFDPAAYHAERPGRDEQGKCQYNDIVTVTYSSVSTNNFESYGECVMGSAGTMVVETEQNVYLWGGNRSTTVTANTTGGRPALDTSSSTGPGERLAADAGQTSLGHTAPSRGYREEMEHFAFCIRQREQGMATDRADLKPRCDGRVAMADAIVALTANQAMRRNARVVFDPRWFDPAVDDVPDGNMQVETLG